MSQDIGAAGLLIVATDLPLACLVLPLACLLSPLACPLLPLACLLLSLACLLSRPSRLMSPLACFWPVSLLPYIVSLPSHYRPTTASTCRYVASTLHHPRHIAAPVPPETCRTIASKNCLN